MKSLIDTSGYEMLFYIFAFLIIVFFIGTWFITISMAEKRGRNQVLWFILSIIFPIYAIFALFFLGETQDRRMERIMEEERWRKMERD